jgi:4-amino-4-deoxy-L-arabinose transferase-like glycosyltransferase
LTKRSKKSSYGGRRPRISYRFVWKYALIVLLVALAFRGAYLLEASRRPDFDLFYMDEEYHLEWARGLASGEWSHPYSELKEGPFFRAPGYPYFLAGLLAFFGGGTGGVRVIQIILGSLSCLLVYGLAARVFGQRVGLLAGLLCSLYWVLAYFDTQLLLPVLLVFLLLAGMFTALIAAERRSTLLACLAGLAFGLYSITRPNILVFFPVLAWWVVALVRRRGAEIGRWFAALFLIGLLLPPALVTIRNRIAGGDWVLIASQGGVNFYIGNNPQSNGMQAVVPGTRQTWWGGYEDTRAIAEEAAGRSLKPSEISDYWFGQAFEYMKDDPAEWLRLTLRKAGAYVGNVELPNNEPYEAYRAEYLSLRSIPLGFGVLFGLFLVSLPLQLKLRRRAIAEKSTSGQVRADFIGLMLALAAVYSLTVIAFFVTGRYRVPMVPFFAIGASVAAASIYDLFRSRAFLKAAVTAGIAVTVVGLLGVDYMGIRHATGGFAALTMAQDRLDTGDVEGAIVALERLRREGSVRAAAVHLTLARAYLRRGSPEDLEAAFQVAEEALVGYPREPELLWYASMGYASRRDWAMVRRRTEALLALKPEDLRALHLAFTAALELGDVQSARVYLDRGLDLDADNPIVADMQKRLSSLPPP